MLESEIREKVAWKCRTGRHGSYSVGLYFIQANFEGDHFLRKSMQRYEDWRTKLNRIDTFMQELEKVACFVHPQANNLT